MEKYKVEHALDILNRKIAKYIRENKSSDIEEFKKNMKRFAEEENKIYELDEEIINKVINQYLKDIKNK